MSYNEVRGTGLAAVCPVIEEGSTNLKDIKPGSYKLRNMCLEPTKIMVKEQGVIKGSEPQWSKTTLLTRQTTNLSEIEADLKVGPDGTVELKESDSYSLNLAPITVQLPGGERVPFLFTIKARPNTSGYTSRLAMSPGNVLASWRPHAFHRSCLDPDNGDLLFAGKELEASGNLTSFGGKIRVPSYRGSTFLDPKGRGGSTGYDTAHALHMRADDEELEKENLKRFDSGAGQVVFSVAKVDPSTGEVAGVFESVQPSDTDMGAKVPKEVMVQGLWYGQLG
ncbi:Oxygen-evolving enhancer protein 1, chloroplastic [Coccomyxa sp. Obi]|nr:Oxygen-evolving enhancer protein 1, chloroplastic [Coccomyxa sp. Obi]